MILSFCFCFTFLSYLSKILRGHTVPHFLRFSLSLSRPLILLSSYTLPGVYLRFCVGILFRTSLDFFLFLFLTLLPSYTLPGVYLRFCVILFPTFLDISVLDLSTFSLLSSLSDSFLRFYEGIIFNNFLFIFFLICIFLS